MIGKCRVCGTEYERRTNGRYCGDGCRRVGAMASYQRTLAKLRAKPKPEPKVARVASCKVCGKEFAANGGRQVYCGKDCYKRAVALNREKPVVDTAKRVCPHCGIEFEARRSGPHEKRFCSQRCSRRHRGREREKRRRAEASAAKYPFERSCKVCGAGFTVTVDNTNQVYCGPACRDAAYKKDNGETVTKRCEHCGKTFEEPAAWERGKRFCSEACERKQERHRRRASEREAFVDELLKQGIISQRRYPSQPVTWWEMAAVFLRTRRGS